MAHRAIETPDAPGAIGPYSQGIAADLGGGRRLLFTAMQIALDPGSGELVSGGIEAETERVLDNLTAILETGGTGWDEVVKATAYFADLADFAPFNEIYGRRVGNTPPARAALEAAALPLGARIAIELIAVTGG